MCSLFVQCCIVYNGLTVSMKSLWLPSPARLIFKRYFHSLLCTLKCNMFAQSESLKSDFEVLAYEYAQMGFLREGAGPHRVQMIDHAVFQCLTIIFQKS